MPSGWNVVMEIPLIAEVENWDRAEQRELFAIQELFREEGPEAFELYAEAFSDSASWDALAAPCPLEFVVQIGKRWIDLRLDILPGRAVLFRQARRT